MWSSSFYLGNFLGPTIAGFTVEAWGFRTASVVPWTLLLVALLVDAGELAFNVKHGITRRGQEYEEL